MQPYAVCVQTLSGLINETVLAHLSHWPISAEWNVCKKRISKSRRALEHVSFSITLPHLLHHLSCLSHSLTLSLSLLILFAVCSVFIKLVWGFEGTLSSRVDICTSDNTYGWCSRRPTARAFLFFGVPKIALIGWGVRSDWRYHGDSRKGEDGGIEVLELDQTAEKRRDKGVGTWFVLRRRNAQVFRITASVEWNHRARYDRHQWQNRLQIPGLHTVICGLALEPLQLA